MPKKHKSTKKKSTALVISRNTTPETLIMEGVRKGVSVDTMERLLVIRREVKAEQAREAFTIALSGFQSECPVIRKDRVVKNKDKVSVRYRYAPLDSIVEQVRPLLQKYRLSFTIDAGVEEKWVSATCKITHELGHSEVSTFKVPVDADAYMTQPQRFAAALTFAKRYAFVNALGILTGDEDTDANEDGNDPIKAAKAARVEVIPKISVEEKFETALAMIRACKDESTVKRFYKDISDKGGKVYNEGQMSDLFAALMEKADELRKGKV